MTKHRIDARCGLMVIDLESGSAVEWLNIKGGIQELFDVSIRPAPRQPVILGDPKTQSGQLVDC